LHEYLEEFPDMQDVLRYTLCAAAPEAKDNDFTWKDFQARNNNELVAIFGNFVNRTLVLTHKYFNGVVPPVADLTDFDKQTLEQMQQYPQIIAQSLENYRFREALSELMNLARLGNKYLTDNEPWKIFKNDPVRVGTILNINLQICAALGALSQPFLPFTSAKLLKMLGLDLLKWDDAAGAQALKAGHSINQPELLFSKIEDEQIQFQVDKLNQTKKDNEVAENSQVIAAKEDISYEEFMTMDLRTATITAAEKVAKTKKLLKLTLDTGIDTRTVVSGIAEFYQPQDIIGMQVVVLANLSPKVIKGIESHGMILMAESNEGKLSFIKPEQTINNGGIIS